MKKLLIEHIKQVISKTAMASNTTCSLPATLGSTSSDNMDPVVKFQVSFIHSFIHSVKSS